MHTKENWFLFLPQGVLYMYTVCVEPRTQLADIVV